MRVRPFADRSVLTFPASFPESLAGLIPTLLLYSPGHPHRNPTAGRSCPTRHPLTPRRRRVPKSSSLCQRARWADQRTFRYCRVHADPLYAQVGSIRRVDGDVRVGGCLSRHEYKGWDELGECYNTSLMDPPAEGVIGGIRVHLVAGRSTWLDDPVRVRRCSAESQRELARQSMCALSPVTRSS